VTNNATLTLLAGGDVGPVVQPVTRLADLIAPVLASADFRFGQCERTYSVRGFYPRWTTLPGGLHSRLAPEYAEIFRTANLDVISLASNHAMEWSHEAMLDTRSLFQTWKFQVVGAGRDGAEAREPAIIEKNGVRVAVLAYCSVLRDGQSASEGAPGVAAIRVRTWYEPSEWQPGCPPMVHTEALPGDVADAQADIRAARLKSDAVVVSMHWGIRHVPKVLAAYQEPVAHALIDAGADVIIGHGPHIPKAVEEYGGAVCFYSIGNFMTTGRVGGRAQAHAMWGMYWFENDVVEGDMESIYGFPRGARRAVLPRLTFSKAGLERISVVPVYINKLAQPEPLKRDDPRFDEALEYLHWVSSEYPHTLRPGDDEILIRSTDSEMASSLAGVAPSPAHVRPKVGSGPGRGDNLSAGPSPWPALRTGRATSTASGSPRDHAAGHRETPWVPDSHGEGMAAPRKR
jgi:hypothetical protein